MQEGLCMQPAHACHQAGFKAKKLEPHPTRERHFFFHSNSWLNCSIETGCLLTHRHRNPLNYGVVTIHSKQSNIVYMIYIIYLAQFSCTRSVIYVVLIQCVYNSVHNCMVARVQTKGGLGGPQYFVIHHVAVQ